jgi:ArsR family transcriptional regulator, arsenate/arsenite/antimonite-responsive transcriptional repressor
MTDLRTYSRIGRALGDGTRLRFLAALADGELCVCQLMELAGLAASTVSKHLSVLEQAGLALRRKDGRWVYYRLSSLRAAKTIMSDLQRVKEVRADRAVLRRIRAQPLEILCRQLRKR